MNVKVNITALAVLLVVGVVVVAAAYRLSNDIREEAERRLGVEEAIAGAMNKQALAKKQLEDRLKAEAAEREFNRFVYGSSSPPPEIIQQRIERNTRRLAEQNKERESP